MHHSAKDAVIFRCMLTARFFLVPSDKRFRHDTLFPEVERRSLQATSTAHQAGSSSKPVHTQCCSSQQQIWVERCQHQSCQCLPPGCKKALPFVRVWWCRTPSWRNTRLFFQESSRAPICNISQENYFHMTVSSQSTHLRKRGRWVQSGPWLWTHAGYCSRRCPNS